MECDPLCQIIWCYESPVSFEIIRFFLDADFQLKVNIFKSILTYHPFLGILPELVKFLILLSHQ